MWRWIRYGIGLIVAAIIGLGLLLWWAYTATQKVPEFYERMAVAIPAEKHHAAGQQLEKQVVELRNEVRHEGRWELTVTDEQINGWLASDLPEKFPKLLPAGVTVPRISITSDRIMVGCRYDEGKLKTVLSLELEAYLADEPNVIALRLHETRAGNLPLPVKQFFDKLEAVTRHNNVPVRWTQVGSDLVALISIPSDESTAGDQRSIVIESLTFRVGEMTATGQVKNASTKERAP